MNKKVVITGATGFIGKHLCDRLHKEGYELIIFSRNPYKSEKLIPYASKHVIFSSELTYDGVRHIDGAFAVINLAGAPIAGRRWSKEVKNQIFESRVKSTKALTNIILNIKNPPEVFISNSAVGYYGMDNPDTLDETSPQGNDFLANLCFEWELAALRSDDKTRVVIPRIGIVFGKDGGALPKMVKPFKFFVGGIIGDGMQPMPWIHIDDLVELYIWSLTNSKVSGILNFTGPVNVLQIDLAKAIGNILHKPYFMKIPGFILKLIFGESADVILKGSRVFPKRALELGYKFKFPDLKTALEDLLSPL